MDMNTIIAATAATAAVLSIIISIYYQHKGYRVQFFSECTRRYHEIISMMPKDVENPKAELTPEMYRCISLYFNLISEELYIKKRGYVSKFVWDCWVDGLKANLKKSKYRNVWNQSHNMYYDDFKEFMFRIIAEVEAKNGK